MADKEPDEHEQENGEEGAETAAKSKHDRANAADLQKVTDMKEEESDNEKDVPNEKLDSLMSTTQTARKKVNVKKEDVQLIVDELELPRARAEKKLMEYNGDVIAALKDLMGF